MQNMQLLYNYDKMTETCALRSGLRKDVCLHCFRGIRGIASAIR